MALSEQNRAVAEQVYGPDWGLLGLDTNEVEALMNAARGDHEVIAAAVDRVTRRLRDYTNSAGCADQRLHEVSFAITIAFEALANELRATDVHDPAQPEKRTNVHTETGCDREGHVWAFPGEAPEVPNICVGCGVEERDLKGPDRD